MEGTWSNWAGNQICAPVAVEHPASEDDLVALVKTAATANHTVKVVGAGHSFTDIACTTGYQVQLDRYDRILNVDQANKTVTVQSGVTIAQLNKQLASHNLAMPNLGDIAYQTISGAISTATHGTGIKLGGIATQVKALSLVTGDGSVISCSADDEPEVFACARVGLGALGILSTVTLQCVPSFNLRAIEKPMKVDDLLASIDEHVDGNDHFEFFYVPHTRWALTKTNNRTDDPVGGLPKWKEVVNKVVLENIAFGAVCRLGRMRPKWIPRLNTALPSTGVTEYVKPSYGVFASPRWVHFVEMEYSIPRAECGNVLQAIRKFIDDSGLKISFPIEVRFTAADDIPLSTANGSDRCYIAIHVYKGMPHEQYFRGVEAIMDSVGGRPHWGKMHYQTAATLAPRYAEWDRFQTIRRRIDPDGRFRNVYLDRVLGPIGR